ncbi:MAG: glycosyl hydrolase family 28-related protein [Betaproteobacteria bacterium]
MNHLATTVLLISASAFGIAGGRAAGKQAPPRLSANAVNLREHGARGNGSTDDTAAVVSAFGTVCASGGGTIDIPAGTYIIDPASSAIPICSNLLVRGPGTLKVKPDAGNYRCIFAPSPATAAVNDTTFTGITVDQNAYRNTTAIIDAANTGSLQLVWQIFAGTNLHFEDMHLYVSGVDPIDVNGPAVSGVYVEHNHIVFQKRREQAPFDNSSVYIDGDNFHVTDNTFVSTPSDLARTAIEIHSGSGSVAGNTIDHYSAGMNLVDLHGASAIGNNVRNASYGISLWSTKTMDSMTVSGNTIAVAQATRNTPSAWGIATSYNAGINGDFANLQISGNVVTFERELASRTISNHVNYGIGLQALGNVSNVLILGNEIIQPPVRGITVGVADARYTTSRVSVRDNRIVDAGSNASSGTSNYSAGIAVQGNLSSVDVLRNRLDFLSSPFVGHYSYWSLEAGFTFRNVVVAENYVTAVDGSPANGLTASVRQAVPPQ